MKKSLYLFLVFVCAMEISSAQNHRRFTPKRDIPVVIGGQALDNPWAGGINFPLINSIDLDHDGRMDIILYDRFNERLMPFINTGNASVHTWQYAPAYTDSFPPVNKWVFTYDYNCDGKMDLFMLSSLYPSGIKAYRNDYTPGTGMTWTLVNPFMSEQFSSIVTNIFASGVSLPAFIDIDNDGDMDILGYNSVPDGRIVYHKNNSMDFYGHCDSLVFKYETGSWGSFALQIGGTNQVGCFNCRMRNPGGGPLKEDILTYDPSEAARRDDTISSIFPIDLDCDGDKELLIGDISSKNTLMVHNAGTPATALMDSQDTIFPSYDSPALFNGFHYHSYFDVDNDGKKDLVVSAGEYENKHGNWWYRNTGTTCAPDFNFTGDSFLQETMIDVGENASPVLFDYDGDGLLDLVIGATTFDEATASYKNSLYLYKNTGTSANPSFELITDDMAGIKSLNYTGPLYPAFGDLDGDGDMDMMLGTENGQLQYFNNSAGAGNPASFQLAIPNFPGSTGIDVGSTSTPQLIDLNRDGTLDLIVGEKNGFVNYFQNSGTATNPVFSTIPTEDTLGCINLQVGSSHDGYTVPFVYDSLGKYRMLVSNMAGNVYFYDNIDNNLTGCFTLKDSVYTRPNSNRIKYNLTVSGGDLNGDSFPDLVIGQASGGVEVFYQYNPTASVSELPAVRPSLELFPNPAGDLTNIRFYNLSSGHDSYLRVIDPFGKCVIEKRVEGVQMNIALQDLSAGLYLVQLTSGDHSLTRKLLVEH